MIWGFGNSHAAIFSGIKPCGNIRGPKLGVAEPNPNYKNIRTIFLGPIIAYNFRKSHLPTLLSTLSQYRVDKNNDSIALYVGEVDCRFHLAKRIMEKEDTAENIVSDCIKRYYSIIKQLKDEGWKMIVFGTHPTTTKNHSEDLNSPYWGTCKFRNDICVMWNKKLKECCDIDNIPFISIYDKLVDENNITKMEYFLDYCHLSYDKCFPMFVDEMRKNGIEI